MTKTSPDLCSCYEREELAVIVTHCHLHEMSRVVMTCTDFLTGEVQQIVLGGPAIDVRPHWARWTARGVSQWIRAKRVGESHQNLMAPPPDGCVWLSSDLMNWPSEVYPRPTD